MQQRAAARSGAALRHPWPQRSRWAQVGGWVLTVPGLA